MTDLLLDTLLLAPTAFGGIDAAVS